MDEEGGHATAPHALQLIPQGLRKPRRCKLAGAVVRKAGAPCMEKGQQSAEQNVREGLLLLADRGCQGPSMATQLNKQVFQGVPLHADGTGNTPLCMRDFFPLHSHALPNTLFNP